MHRISDIISNTEPRLSKLMQGQDVIEKIKTVLQEIDILKQNTTHYKIVKFSQGILHFSISSPAFATQIRHSSIMILRNLRNKLPNIQFNAIQCGVTATVSTSRKETPYRKNKPKTLSEKTKVKLTYLSERIDSTELSAALKKLVAVRK